MRADGLTVGEAMYRDAAFLRSIGIDAKDGQPTFDEAMENYIEDVERRVLNLLDEIAKESPAMQVRSIGKDIEGRGWIDQDLKDFLPDIRKHAYKMFLRSRYLMD